MVYGRILYNNIKEYTPKFFPTIPYSQTVKPTFGTPCNIQSGNPKLYLSGTPTLMLKEDGDYSVSFSTIAGHINYSCSDCALVLGQQSTSPTFGSTSTITVVVLTKQQWPKREPTRKNWENKSRQSKQLKEQLRRQQLQRDQMISDSY